MIQLSYLITKPKDFLRLVQLKMLHSRRPKPTNWKYKTHGCTYKLEWPKLILKWRRCQIREAWNPHWVDNTCPESTSSSWSPGLYRGKRTSLPVNQPKQNFSFQVKITPTKCRILPKYLILPDVQNENFDTPSSSVAPRPCGTVNIWWPHQNEKSVLLFLWKIQIDLLITHVSNTTKRIKVYEYMHWLHKVKRKYNCISDII